MHYAAAPAQQAKQQRETMQTEINKRGSEIASLRAEVEGVNLKMEVRAGACVLGNPPRGGHGRSSRGRGGSRLAGA